MQFYVLSFFPFSTSSVAAVFYVVAPLNKGKGRSKLKHHTQRCFFAQMNCKSLNMAARLVEEKPIILQETFTGI